jgi:hypothetical protein
MYFSWVGFTCLTFPRPLDPDSFPNNFPLLGDSFRRGGDGGGGGGGGGVGGGGGGGGGGR